MAKRVSKTPAKRKTYPQRRADIPVTQKMLYLVRDELKEAIIASEHRCDAKINTKFNELNGKFESKFNELNSTVEGLNVKFDGMSGQIHQLSSDVYRLAGLIEEQNARNAVVLDGLTSLFARQERVERRMDHLETNFANLTKSKL